MNHNIQDVGKIVASKEDIDAQKRTSSNNTHPETMLEEQLNNLQINTFNNKTNFINDILSLEEIEKIIDIVANQRKEQYRNKSIETNLSIATNTILGKNFANELNNEDVLKIKVYKFFDLINTKSEDRSLSATLGEFKELTSHVLINNKLYFNSDNFLLDYAEFEKTLIRFKEDKKELLNPENIELQNLTSKQKNLKFIENKKEYLWAAHIEFYDFLDKINNSSRKVNPEEDMATSLEFFSGLHYKKTKNNEKNKTFSNVKKTLHAFYDKLKTNNKNISKIVEEYNSSSVLDRNKLQKNYFKNEQDFYALLNNERHKGTKIKYSSKLFEENNAGKYKEHNLREAIANIYAHSKTADEAVLEVKEKLNIIMSKSSLYEQVRKYREEEHIEGKISKLNGMEVTRTDKKNMFNHFQKKTNDKNIETTALGEYGSILDLL